MQAQPLPDFPSASAIEYDSGQLFLFGDDAPYLLVLDTNYRRLDTVHFMPYTSYRVDKNRKWDIESAAIFSYDSSGFRRKALCALGSFSAPGRNHVLEFPLAGIHRFFSVDYSAPELQLVSLPGLNIEGFAVMGGKWILANRANLQQKLNQLVILQNPLFTYKSTIPRFLNIRLNTRHTAGISGLCYLEDQDLLLFTASTEETSSATQDGAIGESYLGYLHNFSNKLDGRDLSPDTLIPLSSVHQDFRMQKVESLCIQEVTSQGLLLQLVADNDNGKSMLFKLLLPVR